MGEAGRRLAIRALFGAALAVAVLGSMVPGARAAFVPSTTTTTFCNLDTGVGCVTPTTRPPTTTTTLPPPTTTTTTLPGPTTTIGSTPTTRRSIPPPTRPTATTSPPATVAPTTSAPTAPPTTVEPTTVPAPPPTTVPAPPALTLSQPSIEPGGQLSVHGRGCSPASDVRLTIGDTVVGSSVADDNGTFSAPITVPDMPLGQYSIVALCGPTLTGPLVLAVSTSAQAGTGTLGLFFFFFLLVLMLFRRRRLVRSK